MVTRFDHLVIGVRDLDRASEQYQRLGFEVRPGGKHTGLGTYNALIRFGLDYIELISQYEQGEVAGVREDVLRTFLQQHEGGLLGYALATESIEQDAEHLRQVGLPADGPFAMQRMRPDGQLLSWRLLVPGGVSWRRPWPFLIQWDAPDEQRLQWELPGIHANGATGWVRVAVGVKSLERGIDLYQRQLGLAVEESIEVPSLGGRGVRISVGRAQIDILEATRAGRVQDVLAESGEGPVEISLAVKDLAEAERVLTQNGVGFEQSEDGTRALLIAEKDTLGARIILVHQS